MRIKRVTVQNYRNIHGITVHLNKESNYVIGENNLGKSNLLALLATICQGAPFSEWDFDDPQKEILIDLQLEPDLNEATLPLAIRYAQSLREGIPTVTCIDSGETLPISYIRRINYISHQSAGEGKNSEHLTDRAKELLLSEILKRFIDSRENSSSLLNRRQLDSLTHFINEHLENIRTFRGYGVETPALPSMTEMLAGLFFLSDGGRKIVGSSSGVRYMTTASLSILCQIMKLYQRRGTPFSERLYTDQWGRKILPLVLSIDEPEVHLHPYLQRALIGRYRQILRNQDSAFAELLKLCFGVDGLDGQLIIVTHSTDALIGDYRNLVRFYKCGERTAVISGAELDTRINAKQEKHLIMHFPEIKEAFYAHCALLLEGETEYGCIHTFAERLGVSLNDYGICVINARGEGTIAPLRRLLRLFAVPSVAIYDGDVRNGRVPAEGEFFTEEPCFEIEIVKALYAGGRMDLIRQIAIELDSDAGFQLLTADFVRKPFKKMNVDLTHYTPKKLSEADPKNEEEFTQLYAAWFMRKKGVLLGRIIGELLPVELIPNCYHSAVTKAQRVAVESQQLCL